MPLADIVFPAGSVVVNRVEISLQESRVAREGEAPVPRSWPWRAGSGDRESRLAKSAAKQDAAGLNVGVTPRVSAYRCPRRRLN